MTTLADTLMGNELACHAYGVVVKSPRHLMHNMPKQKVANGEPPGMKAEGEHRAAAIWCRYDERAPGPTRVCNISSFPPQRRVHFLPSSCIPIILVHIQARGTRHAG